MLVGWLVVLVGWFVRSFVRFTAYLPLNGLFKAENNIFTSNFMVYMIIICKQLVLSNCLSNY